MGAVERMARAQERIAIAIGKMAEGSDQEFAVVNVQYTAERKTYKLK